MTRRANGDGSIHQRKDGRWCASISVGRGKRKHYLGWKRADVAAKLAQALADKQKGTLVVSGRQSVRQFFASWLETARPALRERTATRYEQLVRLHVMPDIGKVSLQRLAPVHLQSLYSDKLKAGLSPTTVHHLHAVIHKGRSQAVRWNLVHRNVADFVDPPRIERFEMRTLSPDEARRCSPPPKALGLRRSTWSRSRPACARASCSACDGRTSISKAGRSTSAARCRQPGRGCASPSPRR